MSIRINRLTLKALNNPILERENSDSARIAAAVMQHCSENGSSVPPLEHFLDAVDIASSRNPNKNEPTKVVDQMHDIFAEGIEGLTGEYPSEAIDTLEYDLQEMFGESSGIEDHEYNFGSLTTL